MSPDLKAHSPSILRRIRGLFDIRYWFQPSSIIPVMVINDKYYTPSTTANASIAASAQTATLFTSRTDKNTYIHSAYITVQYVAVGSVSNTIISCTQNGANVVLMRINTVAAAEFGNAITFPKPVLIDRNTTVTIDTDENLGASGEQATGIVSFSEEDAQEAFF